MLFFQARLELEDLAVGEAAGGKAFSWVGLPLRVC